MAINEAYIEAPPSAVWKVLCDPYAYPRWVVGTDRTVEADPGWPAPDSKFKVRIFRGYCDYTHSREIDPEKRIVLDAAGGPFGAARIVIELHGDETGTRVKLVEEPMGWLKPLDFLPPVHWAIKLRNVESLRRFKRIAESVR
jgi:uncharacterized protein YndB with AHSA1/START domain